jgi:hypothetical protein
VGRVTGAGNGFLVAGNDDDDSEGLGVGSRMVFTAPVSGVYVIEASTFNGLDTGTYTLSVSISGRHGGLKESPAVKRQGRSEHLLTAPWLFVLHFPAQ